MPRFQRNRRNLPFRQKARVATLLTPIWTVTGANELTLTFEREIVGDPTGTIRVTTIDDNGGLITQNDFDVAYDPSVPLALDCSPALAANVVFVWITQAQAFYSKDGGGIDGTPVTPV